MPKSTKSVPQTKDKKRKIILRDESEDEEAQVHVSEPVAKESQEAGIGGSRPLKRLRKVSTNHQTPIVSPPQKKYTKAKAGRPVLSSDSESTEDGKEAAAEEGDQESLISTEPIIIEQLPSTEPASTEAPQSPIQDFSPAHTATPSTSSEIDIDNLHVPEVLYLKSPPSTPLFDA